jgi:hypothetical protein
MRLRRQSRNQVGDCGVEEVDDQKEVRASSDCIRGTGRFGLDNAVRSGDSDFRMESEAANWNAADSGIAGFQVGAVLLADAD